LIEESCFLSADEITGAMPERWGMRFGKKTILASAILFADVLAAPSVCWAQTTQPGTLRTPRNNVKGGALASNRPGTWVAQGIANHVERQKEMLQQYGGANYQGPEQYPPSKREVFMVSFFEDLFEILNELVGQLTLAIQASQAVPQPVE